MKKLFYLGILGILFFEVISVYFLMPMPGSQRMDSLDIAYLLHSWRWYIRFGAVLLVLAGAWQALRIRRWWLPAAALVAVLSLGAYIHWEMAADTMFYQPKNLRMSTAQNNTVPLHKLVLGVNLGDEARAYPIQFIGYHHQVRDTLNGTPIMVTYCTVCRSGRVFLPKNESFRLVGMDHFNAMFEDATTGSWWRQATGDAVAGPMKGAQLEEIPAVQSSLENWLVLYPNSKIMQADSLFKEEYDHMDTYDLGIGRGPLTGTDTVSWNDKAWVAGVSLDKADKAYDWNTLKEEQVINDRLGKHPIVVALSHDGKTLTAFTRPDSTFVFTLKNDTLYARDGAWNLLGESARPGIGPLKKVQVYQEFWHSWSTFHPHTTRF
jgi:hypothetical protein